MTSYQQPSTAESDPSLKNKATEAVDQSRQAAGQVAQTATGHAQEVKEEAVRQARDLMGEARQRVSEQVGGQHQNLVGNLRSLSSELSSMVERSEQSGTATELVSQARERLEGAANWMEGRQPSELLDEVKNFARRRPGAFLLGALAAGVVVGRLTRGAMAAHQDNADSSSGSAVQGAAFPAPAGSTYEPGGGYAHTTGQAGYEQGNGSAGGYVTGGGYAEPAGAEPPRTEPGYGGTSTYGTGGTPPYPAAGYQNGGTQR